MSIARKILRPIKRKIIEVIGGEIALSTLRVRLVGSTHPRRITFYQRFFLKKTVKICNFGDPTDDSFYAFEGGINNEDYAETLILYVGDSLTEYLSRVRSQKNNKFNQAIAVWLGAKTRLGFSSEKDFNEARILVNRAIEKKYFFDKSFKKIILVWSSGSIDIRCSFYELLISRTFDSEKELFQLYEEKSKFFLDHFLMPLAKEISADKTIILSATDSILEGEEPLDINEVKKIRLINPYPTLGSRVQRVAWRNKANLVSQNLCFIRNLEFLDINPFIDYANSSSEIADGIHMTNPATILKINNFILGL